MARAMGLAFLAAAWASSLAAAEGKHDTTISQLTVTVDPLTAAKLSGKPGVAVFRWMEDVEKSLGKAVAKQIAGKVDFAKQDLVHVAWGSSGPPFGTLRHETRPGKEGEKTVFFVEDPKVAIRGQAYRLGNDFFAVPKKTNVQFGK
jgi:hypothetical protein